MAQASSPPMPQFMREIGYHIRACYPYLLVVTDEQDRLMTEIGRLIDTYLSKDAKKQEKFKLYRWTVTQHWTLNGVPLPEKDTDEPQTPLTDFAKIKDMDGFSIFVMENFHFYLTREAPELIQLVKDYAKHCKEANKVVVFANSSSEFPAELEPQLTMLDHELPATSDILGIMDAIIETVKDNNLVIKQTEEQRFKTIESLKGMRMTDVENALAYSVVTTKTFDPKVLLAEKCKAIKKVGMLEYISTTESMDLIGGLEALKEYLVDWRIAFTADAKKYNLRFPKGILLVGVPGCGKSLSAKAIANVFALPLIRFDMSSIFSKFVGESEQNVRKGLKTVDAVAPCVLWIDEIEKGMSGASSSNSTDGGTSPRVFGKFLEWMNDHTSPVFVVATSNNIDTIPVEFTRKGRFDEIFFVDIPNKKESRDIFHVQFTRQKLVSGEYNLDALVDAAVDFTGAEIAYAVEKAKLTAANQKRFPTTDDVIKAIRGIQPEAKKNKTRIDHIRSRASQIAIPASRLEEKPAEVSVGGKQFRAIQA